MFFGARAHYWFYPLGLLYISKKWKLSGSFTQILLNFETIERNDNRSPIKKNGTSKFFSAQSDLFR